MVSTDGLYVPSVIKFRFIYTETDFEEYPWDTFFVVTNGCRLIGVRCSDEEPEVACSEFARLTYSLRSTHRSNRMYLFLRSVDFLENVFEADKQDLFHTRKMDFMTDLVTAKLLNEDSMTYEDVSAGET